MMAEKDWASICPCTTVGVMIAGVLVSAGEKVGKTIAGVGVVNGEVRALQASIKITKIPSNQCFLIRYLIKTFLNYSTYGVSPIRRGLKPPAIFRSLLCRLRINSPDVYVRAGILKILYVDRLND
jgi:hypothetical protein